MEKKDIEYFREFLTSRLEELLNNAEDTVSGMTTQKENFPDPTDRAFLETDLNFMLRIRDRERKLTGKIRKALSRIENGTFGICEKCGEDILNVLRPDLLRLNALIAKPKKRNLKKPLAYDQYKTFIVVTKYKTKDIKWPSSGNLINQRLTAPTQPSLQLTLK
jgi:DnaK suppressor protein